MSCAILQKELKEVRIVNRELAVKNEEMLIQNALLMDEIDCLKLQIATPKPSYYSAKVKGVMSHCDICDIDVCISSMSNHLKSRIHKKIQAATNLPHAVPILESDESI